MAKKKKKGKKKLYLMEYEEIDRGCGLVWADDEVDAKERIQDYVFADLEGITAEKVNRKDEEAAQENDEVLNTPDGEPL